MIYLCSNDDFKLSIFRKYFLNFKIEKVPNFMVVFPNNYDNYLGLIFNNIKDYKDDFNPIVDSYIGIEVDGKNNFPGIFTEEYIGNIKSNNKVKTNFIIDDLNKEVIVILTILLINKDVSYHSEIKKKILYKNIYDIDFLEDLYKQGITDLINKLPLKFKRYYGGEKDD